jgi:hypothetical protein
MRVSASACVQGVQRTVPQCGSTVEDQEQVLEKPKLYFDHVAHPTPAVSRVGHRWDEAYLVNYIIESDISVVRTATERRFIDSLDARRPKCLSDEVPRMLYVHCVRTYNALESVIAKSVTFSHSAHFSGVSLTTSL